jgi:hypothetical protein
MPSVHGSANGLRNITCSAAPAIASAPPASNAIATRGRRIWKKIIPSAVHSPVKNTKTSRISSFSAPIHGKIAKKAKKQPKTGINFPVFW